jgi:hypothetical protein
MYGFASFFDTSGPVCALFMLAYELRSFISRRKKSEIKGDRDHGPSST